MNPPLPGFQKLLSSAVIRPPNHRHINHFCVFLFRKLVGGKMAEGRPAESKKKKSANLEDQVWYHGILPRNEITRLLKDDGMFLVKGNCDTFL